MRKKRNLKESQREESTKEINVRKRRKQQIRKMKALISIMWIVANC